VIPTKTFFLHWSAKKNGVYVYVLVKKSFVVRLHSILDENGDWGCCRSQVFGP
jgi:hypothetical protein